MSDSTEQQENSTEAQSAPAEASSAGAPIFTRANFAKTGCSLFILAGIVAIAAIWASFSAPYQVECGVQGTEEATIRKFGDLASADSYYVTQVAAGESCTRSNLKP